MNKFLISIVMALALVGAVDARPGSSSSSSSRSSSSSSPSRGISLSKSPAPAAKSPGINLTKPAATPAATPSKGINLAKPASAPAAAPTQSRSWFGGSSAPRNSTVTVVHEHHYFGGGYGYGHGYYGGYSGGFGSSPFFWLWLLDRPQPQTVIVNGQPQAATGGASASYAAPSSGETFVNVLLGVLMLTGIVALVVWIVRKIFFSK